MYPILVMTLLAAGGAGLLAGAAHAGPVEPDLAIAPSRLPQRLDESPSAVTVIDRRMLRESGVRRIADILRLVPGMVVGSRSAAIQPATYIGLSDEISRRIQVLVDGHSIFAPSTGAVLWQDLPFSVDDIERIEVVRGPNTAAYGSHALLATIKIITASPREVSRWGASVNAGSNGVRDAYARLAGGGRDTVWVLSYTHQQDEGLVKSSDVGLGGRKLDGLRLRGESDLSPATSLQWDLTYSHADNGLSNLLDNDVSASINNGFTDENDYQFLTLRHRQTSANEWVWRFSRRAQHYQEPDIPRQEYIYQPGSPLPEDLDALLATRRTLHLARSYRAVRLETELENHFLLTPNLRGVWGLGLRREDIEGELFFGEPGVQRQDSARLFSHAEWKIAPDWLLNGGAMLENNSISGNVFTPRLALIHHPAPSHTLRLGWSTGVRHPLLFENQGKTATWLDSGEPVWLTLTSGAACGGVQVERATEWSLGYLWAPNRHTRLDLRAYHLRLDDPVRALMRLETGQYAKFYGVDDPNKGWIFLPLVLDMRNVGAVRVTGIEVALDTRLGHDTWLNLSYGHADARELEALAPGSPDYAESVPRHTAGMLLTHRFDRHWDASLRMHYTAGMRWGFIERDRLNASHSVNARLGYVRRWGGQRLRADLIGENLDGTVRDFGLQRGWGRAVWLRLSLEAR